MTRHSLSIAEARRIALAAQGFAASRPAKVNAAHVRRLVQRLGVVQIDSVNVLARSHYLIPFARLGSYANDLLDELTYNPKRRALFEYWGHEASLLPVELQPLFRWRMQRAEQLDAGWNRLVEFGRTRSNAIARALKEICERGPLGAGELLEGGKGKGSWWGWSDGKLALEWLFWAGKVTTTYRRSFERVYDLTERVIPREILAVPTPSNEDAHRELMRIAARAQGIATERDLRDYYRLSPADAKPRILELVESGELAPVAVEGWKQPGYLWHEAKLPRSVDAFALLSPFDSLIWERSRTERLFDFVFRLEIYTPAHKRVHGYYVLPFLCGDRLAARVDLKANRKAGRLDVQAVHYEAGAKAAAIRGPLHSQLEAMAAWLGLENLWFAK